MKNYFPNFRKIFTVSNIKKSLTSTLTSIIYGLSDAVDDLMIVLPQIVAYIKTNWRKLVRIAGLVAVIVLLVGGTYRFDRTVPQFDGVTRYEAEMYVYRNCHWMTNNFIIAEDGKVDGKVFANDTNINRLMAVISEYHIAEHDMLIDWLSEFRKGDYSNAVEFHNYCWELLHGEVGYAENLKRRYR